MGHSVSGIIGLIAAQKIPHRIHSMVMVCPSPCFLNIPPDYFGGFDKEDLSELIDLMDKNYIGWAQYLAPLVTGRTEQDIVTSELTDSFCSTNPRIGGEEFAICTMNSTHDSPDKFAEKLLSVIRAEKIHGVEVTVSIGIVSSHTATYEDLYKSADQMLYEAKNRGRNQFISALI